MDRLKAKRTARRSQNTKLVQEARTLINDPNADISKLTGILDRLSSSNQELSSIKAALEEHIPDDELEAEYSAAAEYNDQAIGIPAELRCQIAALGRVRSAPQAAVSAETSTVAQTNAQPTTVQLGLNATTHAGLRLPKLSLPTFSGDVHNWTGFWEQFEQTVHHNETLPPTIKFYYLRNCLAGQAAASIAGLPTSEACYTHAIEILKERFGDRKKIEQYHLSALRNLPHVVSGNDVRGLRKLYDAAQLHIRCLKALNVPTLSFSAMLVDILRNALPGDIVLGFVREKRRETLRSPPIAEPVVNASEQALVTAASEGELKDLLHFTRMELESREQCLTTPKEHKVNIEKSRDYSTASVLHSTTVAKRECFCSSDEHGALTCDFKISLDAKKLQLIKDNRCFRCTSLGHQARSCHVKLTCSLCHGRHASSMCDPNYKRQESTPTSDSTIAFVSANPVLRCNESSCIPSKTDNGVYLQTFRAWAGHDDNCRYMRGILDGGSQRSFIKEDLAIKLRLKVVREARIAFNVFGRATPSSAEKLKIAEVPLRSQHNFQVCIVQAYMVPFICHDVCAPSNDNEFVRQLRLGGNSSPTSDASLEQTEPGLSLLIGSDNLWKILTGELVRSTDTDGLVAMNSFFGWTFQGPTRYAVSTASNTNLIVCALRVDTHSNDEVTSQRSESFWKLEATSIVDQRNSTQFKTLDSLSEPVNKSHVYCMPHRKVIRRELLTGKLSALDASSHAPGLPSLKYCLDKGDRCKGLRCLDQPISAWPRKSEEIPKSGQDFEQTYDPPSVHLQAQRQTKTLTDITKFSDERELLRANALLLRLVNRSRRMSAANVEISAKEIRNIRKLEICRLQRQAFFHDMRELSHTEAAHKHSVFRDGRPFIYQRKQLRLLGRRKDRTDETKQSTRVAEKSSCLAHCLVGRSQTASSGSQHPEYEARCSPTTRNDLTKLRCRQKLPDHVWVHWKEGYLQELRSLHRYSSRTSKDIEVNDIVLVKKPCVLRCVWPCGRVVEVFPGQDVVRACRVKAQDHNIVRRPAQKLYKLEIACNSLGREDEEKE